MSIAVSPQDLKSHLYQGQRSTVVYTTWAPTEGAAFNQFSSLHIPTSHFADTALAFVGTPGSRVGRNPLPDPDKLQNWFERLGLRAEYPVVIYDDGRGLFAGRAWWTLRWAGVGDVRLLNGGFAAWRRAGLETLTGPGNLPLHSNLVVVPGGMPTATIDEVKEHLANPDPEVQLIDTRSPSRFSGRREHLDLKAGHIPGAINVPERELHVDEETWLWKSPEDIRAVFETAGVNLDTIDKAIIYSGSGNHSALAIAALEIAGLPSPRHFVGGWSQWSAVRDNPTERGD